MSEILNVLNRMKNSRQDKSRRSNTRIILLLAAAFIIRLIVAFTIDTPVISDDANYHDIAVSIAEGKGFCFSGQPTALRPPGYPYFISVIFGIFGESVAAVRCIQAVIDTVACFLLYLIGKICFGRKTAFIGMAIMAFFPLHIMYIPRILTEILFTFFLLLFTWLMLRKQDEEWDAVRILLLASVIAILTLIRPTGGILLLTAGIFIWNRSGKIKENLKNTGLLVLVFSLLLFPWLARNQAVFGRFQLTSTSGINFWIGNNPRSNGGYVLRKEADSLFAGKSEFETSDLAFDAAVRYLTEHPWSYPLLEVKKAAHFFSSDFGIMVFLQFKKGWQPSQFTGSLFRTLSAPLWMLLHLPYIIVMILAIIFLLFGKTGKERNRLILLSIPASFLLVHLIYFGGARFRMPVMPLIILLAADVIAGYRNLRIDIHDSRIFIAAAAILLFLGIFAAEYAALHGIAE
jgi:4-amino-4-deoxy-L-arabinose transferase-like glycosyltransferase